jgi:ATP-dependent exoDNAse (exonuclease V) beta subunit
MIEIKHLSFSSLKSFDACEAEEIAVKLGEWDRQATFSKATLEAMLAGSYVHKRFESTESFREFMDENNSEMFTKSGTLKAQFTIAEHMAQSLEQDPLFKNIYEGTKEYKLEGEIEGLKFIGYIDCLNLEKGVFIDIKTVAKGVKDKEWSDKEHRKVHWIEARKYHWQMAIYQELLRQSTDEHIDMTLNPVIYAITKEQYPDTAGITIPQIWLDFALDDVREVVGKYKEVIEGREPVRCESCNYCKATKRNTRTISLIDLV